jgi:hydantoinase/oxoprolinase-like protein
LRGFQVGVDIGRTFTDLILVDSATGDFAVAKSLTTPDDPARAVATALEDALTRAAGSALPPLRRPPAHSGRRQHPRTGFTFSNIQSGGAGARATEDGLLTTAAIVAVALGGRRSADQAGRHWPPNLPAPHNFADSSFLMFGTGLATVLCLVIANTLWASSAFTAVIERGYVIDPNSHLLLEAPALPSWLQAAGWVQLLSFATSPTCDRWPCTWSKTRARSNFSNWETGELWGDAD